MAPAISITMLRTRCGAGAGPSFASQTSRRDTVLVQPRETVDVRLVPLDLGRWMLHCPILEHAGSGMMTLVEVVR